MNLLDWGYGPFFHEALLGLSNPTLEPARVVTAAHELFRIAGPSGERPAELLGRLRYASEGPLDLPVPGDFVAVQPVDESLSLIHHVLPRRSLLSRRASGRATAAQPLAANVDRALLVTSLDTDFSIPRLQRYAALASVADVPFSILLTKADACPDVTPFLGAVAQAFPAAEILVVSAPEGRGLPEVRALVPPGRTVVLLGSSGVGKSTLLNAVAGRDLMDVRAVREDGTGRHATTRRELFRLPGLGLVLDVPGLREVGLTGASPELAAIEELAAHCRFRDCTHGVEPGCAVRRAVEENRLDAALVEHHERLKREAEWFQTRTSATAAVAEKLRYRRLMGGSRPPKKIRFA
ncbi:MAG: ribosome small subunit-dependent GTPase A [Acidobacteria bacterium]|nr:ribosome small subunit-dependent GTPase A [Acidobacteriota bacterium]